METINFFTYEGEDLIYYSLKTKRGFFVAIDTTIEACKRQVIRMQRKDREQSK